MGDTSLLTVRLVSLYLCTTGSHLILSGLLIRIDDILAASDNNVDENLEYPDQIFMRVGETGLEMNIVLKITENKFSCFDSLNGDARRKRPMK